MINTAASEDFRCIRCGDRIAYLALVVSESESYLWEFGMVFSPPAVRGWTTSCGHYVDAAEYELFISSGTGDVLNVQFNTRRAVK